MIYIKEHIRCKQIEWSCDNELECIGLNVTLSPQMSFTLIGMYRPPSTKSVFFYQFNNMLRECHFRTSFILKKMGDFDINYEDKSRRKILKLIINTFDLTARKKTNQGDLSY